MSYLIACIHCQRLFLPETSNHLCPGCAQDMPSSRLNALPWLIPRRVRWGVAPSRGIKRRRDLQPPLCFEQLLPWLHTHPHVRITGPIDFNKEPTVRDEAFVAFREGLIWFRGADSMSQIPISCEPAEGRPQGRSTISFDPLGFTVYEFGHHIRVEYRL